MTEVELTIGREKFVAELLEEEAQETCRAILGRLPLRGKVIHARWSGEAMWLPMDDWKVEVVQENQTSEPAPGELLYYPGPISEKELLIPYGTAKFASSAGVLEGNHFATIRERLGLLSEVGKSVLWEGAKDLALRAV